MTVKLKRKLDCLKLGSLTRGHFHPTYIKIPALKVTQLLNEIEQKKYWLIYLLMVLDSECTPCASQHDSFKS